MLVLNLHVWISYLPSLRFSCCPEGIRKSSICAMSVQSHCPHVSGWLPAAGSPTFQFESGIPRKTPFKGELEEVLIRTVLRLLNANARPGGC